MDETAGHPRLGKLVRQILRHVPELRAPAHSSIDSVEADADLLDALAEEPRLNAASASFRCSMATT